MPRGVRRTTTAATPPPVEAVAEESFAEEVEEVAAAVVVDAPVKVDEVSAAAHDGGVDLPFSDGEVVLKQRTDDEAVLWIVTNFGRKVRIEPSGTYEVVTGPPFNRGDPETPNQPETE